MESTKTYKVYRLFCKPTGKVYFGITKRPISIRMKQHRKFARKGSSFLISRAIRKHGWGAFSLDVIFDGLSKKEACDHEVRLIKENNSCYENGYNMTPGGETGVSLREETREKRSKAGKAAWERSDAMKASIYSEERLRKISEASKRSWKKPGYRERFNKAHESMVEASKCPEARRRAVERFISNGHSVKLRCSNGAIFNSGAEAARWASKQTGKTCSLSPILACSKGKTKTAYGFKWERV